MASKASILGVLASALLGACVGPVPADFDQSGAKVIIFAIEHGDAGLELHAVEAGTRTPIVLATYDRIRALVYGATLEELQIAPGPLTEPEPDPRNRPLAEPLRIYTRTIQEDRWTQTSDLGDALRAFRLPPIDAVACLQSKGCATRSSSTSTFPPSLCAIPCPEPDAPDPPRPPEPPRMINVRDVHCPIGWQVVTAPPANACAPPATRSSTTCGSAMPRSDGSCAAIGPPCPAGDWADDVDPGARFVLAGAPPNGIGTRASPFGSISQAIGASHDGDVIALSRGRFDESLIIDRKIRIVGACTDETEIAGGAAPVAIEVFSTEVSISRLRLTGGATTALVVAPGGALDIGSMIIADGEGNGVAAAGTLTSAGGGVWVRDRGGHGVAAAGLAVSIDLEAVTVERLGPDRYAILLERSATARVRDLLVRGSLGIGLNNPTGSTGSATITDALIEDVPAIAIAVYGYSHLHLERTIVRRAMHGLVVGGDVRATLTGVAFEDIAERAVWILSPGPRIDVEALAVKRADVAVVSASASTVAVSKGLIEDVRLGGVIVDRGPVIHGQDIVIRESRTATAILVDPISRVDIERFAASGIDTGVAVVGSGATATCTISDATIGDGIIGATVRTRGRLVLERATLSGLTKMSAEAIEPDASLILRDVSASAPQPNTFRVQLNASGGAILKLERVAVSGGRGVNLMDGATPHLVRDLSIEGGERVLTIMSAQAELDRVAISGCLADCLRVCASAEGTISNLSIALDPTIAPLSTMPDAVLHRGHLAISRFDILGTSDRIAFDLSLREVASCPSAQGVVDLSLSDGVIRNYTVGISSTKERAARPEDWLDRVVFREVETPIVISP